MTKHKKKMRQKKDITSVNFSNPWLGSLDRKYHAWKNHKAQSPRKKPMKDKIKENHIKRFKIKNSN